MDYQELSTHLSKPRMERYLKAVSGDENEAVELYHQQAQLSATLFEVIATFEILLRNKVNDFMTTNYDKNWLVKLSEQTSPLNKKNTFYTFTSLLEARKKLENEHNLTNDQMVNSLTFGFWCQLFLPKQYRDVGVDLMRVFIKKPNELNLTKLHASLNVIRQERNKLAHHEPVIFKRNKSVISFYKLDFVIREMLLITKWLNIPQGFYDKQLRFIEEQKLTIKRLKK